VQWSFAAHRILRVPVDQAASVPLGRGFWEGQPFSLLSIQVWHVHRSQHLKAFIHGPVLLLDSSRSVHVGLPEADEHMEVRIRIGKRIGREGEQARHEKQRQLGLHDDGLPN
jgi:hypothetical protein